MPADVATVRGLDARGDPVGQEVHEVLAAEPRVPGGRLDLDHPLDQLQDGDVERAAAQVEHHGGQLAVALVEAIGEGGGGGLVDDPVHPQAGDLRRGAGGLALRFVEVGGHGDHRLLDRHAEGGLGIVLERLQHQGGQLRGGEAVAAEIVDPVGPHVALEGEGRALRMRGRPRPRRCPDENAAVLHHRNGARRQSFPQSVGQHHGNAVLEDGDERKRGAEVDAENGWA